jgi:hypothetical protein
MLKCERCAHEWHQRTPEKPKRCAGCKAPYWWRPARKPAVKSQISSVRGGQRKYPIHNLEVGQKIVLEFFYTNGHPDNKRNSTMSCAILNYARRSGKTFKRTIRGRGIEVERIS